MNKILKFFPVALAAVALASCSNDELADKSSLLPNEGGKTMEANIEDYSELTRAAFAENKNDAGTVTARELVWTSGDSYKLYGELRTPDKYTLQEASAGKGSGIFDLKTDDYNTEPAFAVFPYDKVNADRDNAQLTVTLGDWQYKTAEVQDEGYNQGAFVSDVPMYGVVDGASVSFYYMTGLLRVDLQKLPKKMTRLIVVTSRPLKGTFTAEFDSNDPSALPEIISPVENDAIKETYTLGTTLYTDQYFLTIGTEAVAQRTNKTFFIPVPTGNKYAVFDVYVEYNMGSANKTELVAQLGNTYRLGAGLSALKWERGKVKSLTREITVTSGGTTPKLISQFLKEEWKTFPADADINVFVTDNTNTAAAIDLSSATAADNVFTIPAELKGRVVNVVVDPTIAEGYSLGGTTNVMTIRDDDPAPVASEALRLINFVVPTAVGMAPVINAPESQIVLSAPTGGTATYGAITNALVAEGDMTTEAAGLTIGAGVTTGAITIQGGSFLSEGTIGALTNNDNYETIIKGNAGAITSAKNGKITVKGSSIANTIGTITANGSGDIYVEKVADVVIADGVTNTGAITVDNVTQVTSITVNNTNHAKDVTVSNVKAGGISTAISYAGKGNVSIEKCAGTVTSVAMSNAAAGTLDVKEVTAGGVATITYAGAKAVTIDDVTGGITSLVNCTNANSTGDLTIKNIKGAAINNVQYTGKGNVAVETVVAGGVLQLACTNANAGTLNIKDVRAGGINNISYAGKKAVTIDNIIGGSSTGITLSRSNADNTGGLTMTNIKGGTYAAITNNGIGNTSISGVNNSGYPVVTNLTSGLNNTNAGDVALKDVTIGTALNKKSNGTLTIDGVRATFGTITNAKGNMTITGNNVAGANIGITTQTGDGDVTISDISERTSGTIGSVTSLVYTGAGKLTFTDTFIDAFQNGKNNRAVEAHKNSGIGTMTGNKAVFTNDVWDGSFVAKKASDNIYTTGSFVALKNFTSTTAAKLFVNVDLNNQNFSGIKTNVTSLIGYSAGAISTSGANQVREIKNVKIALASGTSGGLFLNNTSALTVNNLKISTISAPAGALVATSGAAINANYLTVENATIAATKNAGGLIGKAQDAVTLGNTTVKNVKIGDGSTGQGTDAYIGGFIGLVEAPSANITIQKGAVDVADLTGHYYVGGFIGGVKNAKNVYLVGNGALNSDAVKSFNGSDANGCTAKSLTFHPVSIDGVWSTLKSGTIAPFIGGIENIGSSATDVLQIYGEFDSFNRTDNKWNWNFLNDETIKFKGTTRDDINFVGYTVANSNDFEYRLKLISGFEAQPKMNRRSTTATNTILDTDYNVYAAY